MQHDSINRCQQPLGWKRHPAWHKERMDASQSDEDETIDVCTSANTVRRSLARLHIFSRAWPLLAQAMQLSRQAPML
jgi:hypothetical protein